MQQRGQLDLSGAFKGGIWITSLFFLTQDVLWHKRKAVLYNRNRAISSVRNSLCVCSQARGCWRRISLEQPQLSIICPFNQALSQEMHSFGFLIRERDKWHGDMDVHPTSYYFLGLLLKFISLSSANPKNRFTPLYHRKFNTGFHPCKQMDLRWESFLYQKGIRRKDDTVAIFYFRFLIKIEIVIYFCNENNRWSRSVT